MKLTHLHTMLKSRGIQDVWDFLKSQNVTVNLKIDQMSFNVHIPEIGTPAVFGGFDILKRNGVDRVTNCDVLVNNRYLQPIRHMQENTWMAHRYCGWTFFMEHFPESGLQSFVQYSPKTVRNNLIMSYAIGPTGDLVTPEECFITEVCHKFDVEEPPVIHKHNTLSDRQLGAIVDMAAGWGTQDFFEFVVSTFNLQSRFCDKFIPNNLVEGIVIFPNKAPDQLIKLVNPQFLQWHKSKHESPDVDKINAYRREISQLIFSYFNFQKIVEDCLSSFENGASCQEESYKNFIEDLTLRFENLHFAQVLEKYRNVVMRNRDIQLHLGGFREPIWFYLKQKDYWYLVDIFVSLLYWLRQDRKQIRPKVGITEYEKCAINKAVQKIREKGLIG